MKKTIVSCAAMVLVLSLVACCQQQPTVAEEVVSTEDDVLAIQALAENWVAAVEAGDVEAVVDLYTADAVRMPPDAPTYSGREAFADYALTVFDQTTVDVVWPVEGTEEIVVAGDWAYHLSEYAMTITPKAGGEPVEEAGKVVEICRRQPDGSWKFAREIWNLNAPSPQ